MKLTFGFEGRTHTLNCDGYSIRVFNTEDSGLYVEYMDYDVQAYEKTKDKILPRNPKKTKLDKFWRALEDHWLFHD